MKLGDRRKRGRPKAINMERPFSASVVVADEVAGVEVVTVEVAGQQDFAVEVVGLQQEVVLEAAGLEELAMEAPSLEELALDGFVWEEPTRALVGSAERSLPRTRMLSRRRCLWRLTRTLLPRAGPARR